MLELLDRLDTASAVDIRSADIRLVVIVSGDAVDSDCVDIVSKEFDEAAGAAAVVEVSESGRTVSIECDCW
jgi:hypothetical protein